ncbi:hypothetical protein JOE48_005419 [Methylobacterium sp. PvR107]|nr:hypothetical protein [Methylobacterium sp. PvR107]
MDGHRATSLCSVTRPERPKNLFRDRFASASDAQARSTFLVSVFGLSPVSEAFT